MIELEFLLAVLLFTESFESLDGAIQEEPWWLNSRRRRSALGRDERLQEEGRGQGQSSVSVGVLHGSFFPIRRMDLVAG